MLHLPNPVPAHTDMKNFPIVWSVLFLLVACNSTETRSSVHKRLAALDSLVNNQPEQVTDCLEKMDVRNYSRADRAYYNLLLTIARDKSYVEFRDDSIISSATDWFRAGKDPLLFARSLIYLGIVRHTLNPMDTLPYLHLKEAEEVMKIHALEDPQLQVLLYGYMGDINLRNRNFSEAEFCFEKGLEAGKKAGNHRNYIGTLINLFYSKILLKKTDEVEEIVLQLNTLDSIPDELTPYIKKVNAYYYQTGHTLNEAIAHTLNDSLKGMYETDKPRILFDISQFYMKLNRIDSAVVYGKACLDAIVDSMNLDNYMYYKHLAYLYTLTGEYKESSENYKKALEAFHTYHTVVNEERILELEKKYNVAAVQQALLQEKLKKRAFIMCSIILLALVIISICGLRYWKHTAVQNKQLESIKQQKIDQLRFFVNAFNNTAGIIPGFIEEIYLLAHKSRASCPELYENLIKSVSHVNREYHRSFTAITRDGLFPDVFNTETLPAQLSDREKIIYVLSESGFTNVLIAGLLNVSTDNIRSSKSKINRKLEENNKI